MLTTTITHLVVLACLSVGALLACEFVWDLYLKLAGVACFLCVSYLVATFVDNSLPRFRVSSKKKAVFITGCDHGFGLLLARRLDGMGFKVFAGCLRPEKAEELKHTVSENLVLVTIDVTQDESVAAAHAMVESNLGEHDLWCVVNNAGVIERGELEWTPLELYRKQFEVNTFGVVRVTQNFLPLLRKSKGRVVTVTSVGGRFTFSGFVPYCMSKHATSSFCDGLRLEMAKFGVKVISIEPFSYKTGMTEMTTVLQAVKKTWLMSSSNFKNDIYDDAYVEEFSESVRHFNEYTALPDTRQVIDLMVEGVCAVSPHYSYVAGSYEFLLNLWFSKRLPKTFVDYFTRKRVVFDCDLEQYVLNNTNKKES